MSAPLSRLMRGALEVLAQADKPLTPNEIGAALNVERVEGSGSGAGRGSGHRVFGPAQRVIQPLTALYRRGLVYSPPRPDGRSGTAYAISDAGRQELRR